MFARIASREPGARVLDVAASPYAIARPEAWVNADGLAFALTTACVWDGHALQPQPVAGRRAALVAAVERLKLAKLAAGAPFAVPGSPQTVKLIELDDGARADLDGMAATALAALSGRVAWPDSYAQGWIAADNSRLPLPTPADGLALAAAAGIAYAGLVQFARTLKDQILAADPPEGVDIAAGWPL